jgi:predicted secreted protein
MFLLSGLMLASQAHAQSAPVASTSGTMVIVPATAEVRHANDEAVLTLSVEEFDKDKAAAASRVNQKMKQGVEIVKREDREAQLKTQGYYSYPVYPDNQPPMPPQPLTRAQPKPVPIGWRVGQYLDVRTRNLSGLQKTAGAAQKVLAISNVQFGLSPETTKQLDDERIAATYRSLNERVASIARAMGRNVADAVIETVDFEGSGHYVGQPEAQSMVMVGGSRSRKMAEDVAEPSFEPGETTLQMRLVGKVKFR